MFTTENPNNVTSDPILHSQGVGNIGSCRQESVVVIAVLGYAEGPVGPEVTVLADTPHNGMQRMTIPASCVEIYTLHDEPIIDYDRW